MTRYYENTEAADELKKRAGMRAQVEAWWRECGAGIPPVNGHLQIPRGLIGRHVATFRYEDEIFVQLAQEVGLHPLWLEYLGDRFTTAAPVKLALLQRFLFEGVGRSGGHKTRKEVLANAKHWDGKPLTDIVLNDGAKLIEFHHAWQEQLYPGAERIDFTSWLWRAGKSSDRYYELYLSLFVAHAVLFEDYHGGESGGKLDNFTTRVFEAAHARVKARFGVDPLIVPLPWWHGLQYYPATREHRGIIPPRA